VVQVSVCVLCPLVSLDKKFCTTLSLSPGERTEGRGEPPGKMVEFRETKIKRHRIVDYGCFPLCQTDRSETSGTNQGKMERHCSIDTKLTAGPKRSIFVSTEIWTTFSGKFLSGPRRSIYVSTEISGNFGIMESMHP